MDVKKNFPWSENDSKIHFTRGRRLKITQELHRVSTTMLNITNEMVQVHCIKMRRTELPGLSLFPPPFRLWDEIASKRTTSINLFFIVLNGLAKKWQLNVKSLSDFYQCLATFLYQSETHWNSWSLISPLLLPFIW